MFTPAQIRQIREQHKRDHKPGPPVPLVRVWEVKYREPYDDTHTYDDFRTTVSLMFPGPSNIDFALSVINHRYDKTRTPIDIVSVRAVSKAEYIL